MTQVSNFIIPAIIFLVVGIGMLQKVKVYECFLKGAQEGLKVVILMVPTMIGLMVGVQVLQASGFFELVEIILKPLTEKCKFHSQLWTLFLVKLFSSSASTGLVLDYIDDHYSEPITLEQAAQIARFSKFYFTRLFKEYTNRTFYEYLTEKRIHAAEQMLLMPKLAVTEVSIQAGFSSLSSFNRTFKRNKGCSPTEYRTLFTQGGQQENYLRPNMGMKASLK